MGVCQHHFELVALGDTADHVADDATNGSKYCVSFLFLKPHSKLDAIFLVAILCFIHFEWDVPEAFLEGAETTLNFDFSGADFYVDSVWDFEFLFGDDVLHYSLWY